jgi:hypothetical protein
MHIQFRAGLAIAAGMAVASPLSAQTATTTVQQDFEAATALDAGTDKQAALKAWEALEHRTVNARSHAIVLVRKSAVLMALDRKDEAVAAARAGLAGLPAGDATLDGDRYRAHLNLGRVAQSAVDYASAASEYRQALAVADTETNKAVALLGEIETATFVDPVAAQNALAEAKALLARVKVEPVVSAEFARRESLLLLNRGDFEGARAKSAEAVKLLGGLTDKTDLRDVSARSDTAIAALLAGKGDEARRYMAMTGAGRLPTGSFDPALQMMPPDCGGEAGLKPEDMAVIEFSIGNDGSVISSQPVYAAGGGKVALEFARTAFGWSWTPEQVKNLPLFFRYNIRVEMRCSTAFERPSVTNLLNANFETWLDGKKLTLPPASDVSDALALPRQRAVLAAAEAGHGAQSAALLPPLYRLLENGVLPREEKNALARRALAIADANGVPPLPRLVLDLMIRGTARSEGMRGSGFAKDVMPLLSQPPYAEDAQARSALRLFVADANPHGPGSRMRELLRQVADEPALAKNDPMRVVALVRLASLDQQAGDAAAARAAFEESGLAANQCSLIDSPPRMLHVGGSFPQEAMMWGFEGWTRTQFDVSAEGKVVNTRAILSYPPFVFTKAGVETVAGARYAKTYRPDGSLGCGASIAGVRFETGFKH